MIHHGLQFLMLGGWGRGLPLDKLRNGVTGACLWRVSSSLFSLGSGSFLARGQELQLEGLQGAEGLSPSSRSLSLIEKSDSGGRRPGFRVLALPSYPWVSASGNEGNGASHRVERRIHKLMCGRLPGQALTRSVLPASGCSHWTWQLVHLMAVSLL